MSLPRINGTAQFSESYPNKPDKNGKNCLHSNMQIYSRSMEERRELDIETEADWSMCGKSLVVAGDELV